MSDTIYALATPPGKSGVAVIRLSGPDALGIAQTLAGDLPHPRHAYFRPLRDAGGKILDEAVVIHFAAPNSFTGEDVVELQVHGGRAIIASVFQYFNGFNNLCHADAGEFTRRALENGRLDSLQVEALGDFIDADTELQRQASLRVFRGDGGAWVQALRERVTLATSLITAAIDFSDEELPDDLVTQILNELFHVKQNLSDELGKTSRNKSLRQGFRVVIIGRPNVGKSSLINKIAGREVAIATEIPGTTRDVLEVFIDLNGLPVIFMDTAGLRETDDTVEAIGVERAQNAARDADLRIFLYEDDEEREQFPISPTDSDIILRTKSDLNAGADISVVTGEGIDDVLTNVADRLTDRTDTGFFAHDRQIAALSEAMTAIDEAIEFASSDMILYDLLAESARQVGFALDRLIGKIDVEDQLDVIFSKFCIGK